MDGLFVGGVSVAAGCFVFLRCSLLCFTAVVDLLLVILFYYYLDGGDCVVN